MYLQLVGHPTEEEMERHSTFVRGAVIVTTGVLAVLSNLVLRIYMAVQRRKMLLENNQEDWIARYGKL